MAHNSVLRIKKKSWTAGLKDKSKGNYTVGMKDLEFDITWKPEMRPEFIPIVDEHGHQGMRVKITRKR
tara:strand:- start:3004 stop:3207 length:204 start_codon:yes stop_codon:yes gene_type:complete